MNAIQCDVDATVRRIHGGDLADHDGRQPERVEIDDRPLLGVLSFDPSTVELTVGGTQENVSGVFSTLASEFPGGDFPIPMKSRATCLVHGRQQIYQVVGVQNNRVNGARLTILLGALTNRGK